MSTLEQYNYIDRYFEERVNLKTLEHEFNTKKGIVSIYKEQAIEQAKRKGKGYLVKKKVINKVIDKEKAIKAMLALGGSDPYYPEQMILAYAKALNERDGVMLDGVEEREIEYLVNPSPND